jgi:hypothetical protein
MLLTLEAENWKKRKSSLVLLCFIMTAAVSMHALTPLFLILNALFIILWRNKKARPSLKALALVGAIATAALALGLLFSDRFSSFIGDLARMDLVIDRLVNSRLLGGSSEHMFVVLTQVVLAIIVIVIAFASFILWKRSMSRRKGSPNSSDAVTRIPWLVFLLLISNSFLIFYHYGGENVMRIFLYSLVPLSVLIAIRVDHKRFAVVVLAFVLLAPCAGFFARHANERMDYIPSSEIAGSDFFNAHAIEGCTIITPGGHSLIEIARIEDFYTLSRRDLTFWENAMNKTLVNTTNYVIITPGDENLFSYYYDDQITLERIYYLLDGSAVYNRIYSNGDVFIFSGGGWLG